MPIKTAIYDPPIKGLPYLIVTLEADGVKVSTAESLFQARIMASERTVRRRGGRREEALTAIPSQQT
jgi:hypothetical protein